jgi:hypothetical protein
MVGKVNVACGPIQNTSTFHPPFLLWLGAVVACAEINEHEWWVTNLMSDDFHAAFSIMWTSNLTSSEHYFPFSNLYETV